MCNCTKSKFKLSFNIVPKRIIYKRAKTITNRNRKRDHADVMLQHYTGHGLNYVTLHTSISSRMFSGYLGERWSYVFLYNKPSTPFRLKVKRRRLRAIGYLERRYLFNSLICT